MRKHTCIRIRLHTRTHTFIYIYIYISACRCTYTFVPTTIHTQGYVEDVFSTYSSQHLMDLMQLYLQVIKQPQYGERLYELLDELTPKIKELTERVMYGLDVDDRADGGGSSSLSGVERVRHINVFRDISEFISLGAQHPKTASGYFASGICVFLYQNLTHLSSIDAKSAHGDDQKSSGSLYSVYRVIGSISRNCPPAAEYFSNRANKPKGLQSVEIIEHLLLVFTKQFPEEETNLSSASHPHTAAQYANFLYCLTGLMANSDIALTRVTDESAQMEEDYVKKLRNLASKFPSAPYILAAALESMQLIVKTPRLARYRAVLEKDRLGSRLLRVATRIHDSRTVDPDTDEGRAQQKAMISVIDLMRHYNNHTAISSQLNSVPDGEPDLMDRENILFAVLSQSDVPGDDECKLAAAKCFSTIPLAQMSKSELRRVLSLLTDIPSAASAKLYEMLTYIMYFLFRLALDATKGDNASECATVFREIYADETVSLVFGILNKVSAGDENPTLAEYSVNRFQLACVKFLSVGWIAKEFRTRAGDKRPLEVMIKILKSEQTALRYMKNQREQRIARRVCVECSEPLVKSRTRRSDERVSVRCGDCKGSDRNRELSDVAYSLQCPEMTWVGFSIHSMFTCLSELRYCDVVAFRCVHQIANVLRNQSYEGAVKRLVALPYKEWNESPAAHSVYRITQSETGAFDTSPDLHVLPDQSQLRIVKLFFSPSNEKNRTYARLIKNLRNEYNKDVFSVNKTKKLTTGDMESVIREIKEDSRVVYMVMYDGARAVGYISGGPMQVEERDQWDVMYPGHKNVFSEKGNAQIHGMCILPEYQPHAALLLRAFSHELSRIGFQTCFAWVHKLERLLYSSARWINQKGMRSRIAEIDDQNGDWRPFLYKWSLSQNVWDGVESHQAFLEVRGIVKLVSFLNPEREHDSRSRKSKVKVQMLKFGTELAAEFHKTEKEKRNTELAEKKMELKRQKYMPLDYGGLLKDHFSANHSTSSAGGQGMADGGGASAARPVWDSFLIGTEEEIFIRNATVCTSLTPSYHPDADDDPIDDPSPADHKASNNTNNKHSLSSSSPSVFVVDAAQTEIDQSAFDNMEDQLFNSYHPSVCAAMLRCFHTLMTCTRYDVHQRSLIILRDRQLFGRIHKILSSFNYGIRTSILAPPADMFGNCGKFMDLIEQIIDITEAGPKQSLEALDLYEIVAAIVTDVSALLVQLIESRVENTRDPLHGHHRLSADEEALIQATCRVTRMLCDHIAHITFFPGNSVKSAEGNRKCRDRALHLLISSSKSLRASLFSFLLYDLQINSLDISPIKHRGQDASTLSEALSRKMDMNVNDDIKTMERKIIQALFTANTTVRGSTDAEGRKDRPIPCTPRDETRINIIEIIAECFRVDSAFKYNFLTKFSSALFLSDISVRPSLISDIQHASKRRIFRERLATVLSSHPDPINAIFSENEYVIDQCFVEFGVSNSYSAHGSRLLILSSEAYYISKYAMLEEAMLDTREWNPSDYSSLTKLERHSYNDVRSLHLDFSGQMLAVQRYVQEPSARLRYPSLKTDTSTFLVRRLGVMEKIAEEISRRCRDDLNRCLSVQRAAYPTRHAKAKAKEKGKKDKGKLQLDFLTLGLQWATASKHRFNLTGVPAPFLYTHVLIKKKKNFEPRIIMWLLHEGKDETKGGHIIITGYEQYAWDPVMPSPEELRFRPHLNSSEEKTRLMKRAGSFFTNRYSVYDMKDLQSVDFTEDSNPHMVFGFRRELLYACFPCDTSREQWRIELKRYLFNGGDQWFGASVPDFRSTSETTRYLL